MPTNTGHQQAVQLTHERQRDATLSRICQRVRERVDIVNDFAYITRTNIISDSSTGTLSSLVRIEFLDVGLGALDLR